MFEVVCVLDEKSCGFCREAHGSLVVGMPPHVKCFSDVGCRCVKKEVSREPITKPESGFCGSNEVVESRAKIADVENENDVGEDGVAKREQRRINGADVLYGKGDDEHGGRIRKCTCCGWQGRLCVGPVWKWSCPECGEENGGSGEIEDAFCSGCGHHKSEHDEGGCNNAFESFEHGDIEFLVRCACKKFNEVVNVEDLEEICRCAVCKHPMSMHDPNNGCLCGGDIGQVCGCMGCGTTVEFKQCCRCGLFNTERDEDGKCLSRHKDYSKKKEVWKTCGGIETVDNPYGAQVLSDYAQDEESRKKYDVLYELVGEDVAVSATTGERYRKVEIETTEGSFGFDTSEKDDGLECDVCGHMEDEHVLGECVHVTWESNAFGYGGFVMCDCVQFINKAANAKRRFMEVKTMEKTLIVALVLCVLAMLAVILKLVVGS